MAVPVRVPGPATSPARLWPLGVLRVPPGTCPGCAGESHPGFGCTGADTETVVRHLRRMPGAVEVRLSDRDRRP